MLTVKAEFTEVCLELSDRERFRGTQGEVLVLIFYFLAPNREKWARLGRHFLPNCPLGWALGCKLPSRAQAERVAGTVVDKTPSSGRTCRQGDNLCSDHLSGIAIGKMNIKKWAAAWQNQILTCAPSEDSDQPRHLCTLWVAKDPMLLQVDKEDWVDAQADLSRCWAHRSFCWFFLCCGSNNIDSNLHNKFIIFFWI